MSQRKNAQCNLEWCFYITWFSNSELWWTTSWRSLSKNVYIISPGTYPDSICMWSTSAWRKTFNRVSLKWPTGKTNISQTKCRPPLSKYQQSWLIWFVPDTLFCTVLYSCIEPNAMIASGMLGVWVVCWVWTGAIQWMSTQHNFHKCFQKLKSSLFVSINIYLHKSTPQGKLCVTVLSPDMCSWLFVIRMKLSDLRLTVFLILYCSDSDCDYDFIKPTSPLPQSESVCVCMYR